MRKKSLLLLLSLFAFAGAFLSAPQAQAVGGTCQPICTYYSNGTKCCVPCGGTYPRCACTDLYCPPEESGSRT